MDMNDMVERCANMMEPIMGGGMIGNSIVLAVLMALLFIWLIGIAVVSALLFWGVSRLSRMRPDNG
jgi:hypothetical protein